MSGKRSFIVASLLLALVVTSLGFSQSFKSRAQDGFPPTITPGGGLLATATFPPTITPPGPIVLPPIITPPQSPTIDPNITYVAPTLTPADCLSPLPFTPGDVIALTPGISIRLRPTASSPLLIQFQDRRQFTIVEGPVCQGGFNWWRIRGHGVDGWAAEGRRTAYWMRFVADAPGDPGPCGVPLQLSSGERFTLLYNARIRTQPDLDSATQIVVQAGSSVLVLSGSQCADGVNWRRVRATVFNIIYEGWMAETATDGAPLVYLPSPVPCDFPLPLDIGDRAAVTYNDFTPKHLRSAPSLSAPVLADLLLETPLVIVNGPVCAYGYNWWQVRVLTSNPVTGWLAEGGPAQYWIRVVYAEPDTPTPTVIATFAPSATP